MNISYSMLLLLVLLQTIEKSLTPQARKIIKTSFLKRRST
jgi:hypothetical protein